MLLFAPSCLCIFSKAKFFKQIEFTEIVATCNDPYPPKAAFVCFMLSFIKLLLLLLQYSVLSPELLLL